MAVLEILVAPDPRLKQISSPVKSVDSRTRRLMDDMLESMYAAEGIGLAAIQVGVAERIIVMDLSAAEEEPQPLYFVNPEIYETSSETSLFQEGCLSVPGVYEDVERPSTCRARFLDYDGKARDIACSELLAICLQHEIDHLNGVLFIDHLSRLKREMALKRLNKTRRRAQLEL